MQLWRRHLEYVVILGMLLTGGYALVSGLLADLFGFPRFFLHPWAGYACALLVLIHLALNRRRIARSIRLRPLSREKPTPPLAPGQPARLGRRDFLIGALSGLAGFLIGFLLPSSRRPVAGEDLGQQYHRWSKPGGSGLDALRIDWGTRPAPLKAYPQAPRTVLPAPEWSGPPIGNVIAARRSRREYISGTLTLEELSVLLHAAQGITEPRWGFRAAPSAGALYPIETYVVVHSVVGLEMGLYHYVVADHALEQVRPGDLRAELVRAGIGQDMLGTAQVCFILTAVFGRTRWRYRERAYRYILLEAGHIGQNLYLAATGLGLGTCAVGAFLDDAVNRLVGIDGEEETALYLFPVGRIGG